MSIEETFNDRALLDAVTLLSSRDESGRLEITEGSTRGAFFFRKGKLVDARMGPFTGFAAVNLAVSIGGEARLSFDRSIEPPTSSFRAVNERMLLKERFGIETAGPEAVGDRRIVTTSEERALTSPQQAPLAEATFPARVNVPPQKTEMEAMNIGDDFTKKALFLHVAIPFLAQPIALSGTILESFRRKLALLSPSLRALADPLLSNSTRQKVAARAGLIALIVIPVTIGVASYLNKGKALAPLDVSPRETSVALPANGVPDTAQNEEPKIRPKPTIERVSREAQSSTSRTATPLKVKAPALLSDAPRTDNTEAVSYVTAENETPVDEPSAKPSSRAIAVVVQIKEGRVTEAYVRDRQAGLEAYEATALRLARQRRYPKDIKRKETVTLQVTGEP